MLLTAAQRWIALLLVATLITNTPIPASAFVTARPNPFQTLFQTEALATPASGSIHAFNKIRVIIVLLWQSLAGTFRLGAPTLESAENLHKPILLGVFDLTNSLTAAYQPADPWMTEKLMRWKEVSPEVIFGVFSGAAIEQIDDEATHQFGATVQNCLYRYAEGGGFGYAPGQSLPTIFSHPLPAETQTRALAVVQEVLASFETPMREQGVLYEIPNKTAAVTLRIPAASEALRSEIASAIRTKMEERYPQSGLSVYATSVAIDIVLVDKAAALQDLAERTVRQQGASIDHVLAHTFITGHSESDIGALLMVAHQGGVAVWSGRALPPALQNKGVRLAPDAQTLRLAIDEHLAWVQAGKRYRLRQFIQNKWRWWVTRHLIFRYGTDATGTRRFRLRRFYSPPTLKADIYLGRHGETDLNHRKGFQGQVNRAENQLNEEGHRQKEILAESTLAKFSRYARSRPKDLVVIRSPLNRAVQTGLATTDRLAADGIKIPIVESDKALEIDFGIADGMNLEEIDKKLGPALREIANRYRRLDPTAAFPGGESFESLCLYRAYALINFINENYAGKIVIVYGHGTLASALRFVMNDPSMAGADGWGDWRSHMLSNAQLYKLERYPSPHEQWWARVRVAWKSIQIRVLFLYRTVAISGASGQIGAILVDQCLEVAKGVQALLMPGESLRTQDYHFKNDQRLETREGVFPSLDFESAIVRDNDSIIHMAGRVRNTREPGEETATDDEVLASFIYGNSLTTAGFVHALNLNPRHPRFVYASSFQIYDLVDWPALGRPLRESDLRLEPVLQDWVTRVAHYFLNTVAQEISPETRRRTLLGFIQEFDDRHKFSEAAAKRYKSKAYALSKAISEAVVATYSNGVSIRIPGVYGPGYDPESESATIDRWVEESFYWSMRGKPIEYSDVDRHYMYKEDVGRALRAAAVAPLDSLPEGDRVIHIGGPVRNGKEIAEIIAKVAGIPDDQLVPAKTKRSARPAFETSRMRDVLGISEESLVPLEEGLTRHWRWLRGADSDEATWMGRFRLHPLQKAWEALDARIEELPGRLLLFGGSREDGLIKRQSNRDASQISVDMIKAMRDFTAANPEARLVINSAGSREDTARQITDWVDDTVAACLYVVANMGSLVLFPNQNPLFEGEPLSNDMKSQIRAAAESAFGFHQLQLAKLGIDFEFIENRAFSLTIRIARSTVEREDALRWRGRAARLLADMLRRTLTGTEWSSLHVASSPAAVDIARTDKADGLARVVHQVAEERKISADEVWKRSMIIGNAENDVESLNRIARNGGIAVWVGPSPAPELGLDERVLRLINQGERGSLRVLRGVMAAESRRRSSRSPTYSSLPARAG